MKLNNWYVMVWLFLELTMLMGCFDCHELFRYKQDCHVEVVICCYTCSHVLCSLNNMRGIDIVVTIFSHVLMCSPILWICFVYYCSNVKVSLSAFNDMISVLHVIRQGSLMKAKQCRLI